MTEHYIAKTELKKQYDRELDLLKDTLETILSDLHLAEERLARMELLKELQKEDKKP
ncbi:hypothetical protein ES702_03974 [subsurface metagenome]